MVRPIERIKFGKVLSSYPECPRANYLPVILDYASELVFDGIPSNFVTKFHLIEVRLRVIAA